MKKTAWLLFVGALLLCSGCVPYDTGAVVSTGPGFLTGVWHGLIAPFALIGHIFDNDIGFYQIGNAGISYDVGFFLGLLSLCAVNPRAV